jgi:hypothetical protein
MARIRNMIGQPAFGACRSELNGCVIPEQCLQPAAGRNQRLTSNLLRWTSRTKSAADYAQVTTLLW